MTKPVLNLDDATDKAMRNLKFAKASVEWDRASVREALRKHRISEKDALFIVGVDAFLNVWSGDVVPGQNPRRGRP